MNRKISNKNVINDLSYTLKYIMNKSTKFSILFYKKYFQVDQMFDLVIN